MERHERYDPEDIESLLSERTFDQLLPDERAFVLRHMSDRDEYDRMRALLHYVRPDERERGTIKPEDRVKRNVMAAFRAQQQPQWRIWLNTIAAWFVPAEGFAMWRPALAFGSLALLIVAGVVAVRQFDSLNESATVAEVKHVEQEVQASTPSNAEKAATTGSDGTPVLIEELPPVVVTREYSNETVNTDQPRTATSATATSDAAQPYFDAVKYVPMEEDLAAAEVKDGSSVEATSPAPTNDSFSHVVTHDELARNQSVTNAVGAVSLEVASKTPRKKMLADKQRTASRSMAEDPGILGLVAAGW